MSELNQWSLAIVFSIAIVGFALFYLNSTNKKNSGDVMSLSAKIGGVFLSIFLAFTSLIAAAVLD